MVSVHRRWFPVALSANGWLLLLDNLSLNVVNSDQPPRPEHKVLGTLPELQAIMSASHHFKDAGSRTLRDLTVGVWGGDDCGRGGGWIVFRINHWLHLACAFGTSACLERVWHRSRSQRAIINMPLRKHITGSKRKNETA